MRPSEAWSGVDRRTGVAFRPLDEHSQTDGLMRETDGFTYALDEDGDLLWFISPGAYYRQQKREAEAAEPPAAPDLAIRSTSNGSA
jgi:hypothetical protein